MYNGIGLTTPRGSGTNGHVQRNWAFVRPGKKDNSNYRSEEDIQKLDATLNRPPNKEILDHDRKRKIEVKCVEFEEILEKQGRSAEEIKSKVDSYRQKLMGIGKADLPKDEFGRIAVRETHQVAEAQQEKNARLREAFNISEYFVEGSSFDSDRKTKEELTKSLALQKELDAQREAAAAAAASAEATVAKDKGKDREKDKRRYALVRTPSKERDDADDEPSSKVQKKKKKKRARDSSESPERRKDKKKKSKKHKKESKLKKKKSRKRRAHNSDEDEEDEEHQNGNDVEETDSERDMKKNKKSKKSKKKRDKKKKLRSKSRDRSRSRSPSAHQQQRPRREKEVTTSYPERREKDDGSKSSRHLALMNPFRSRSRERPASTVTHGARRQDSSVCSQRRLDERSSATREHRDKVVELKERKRKHSQERQRRTRDDSPQSKVKRAGAEVGSRSHSRTHSVEHHEKNRFHTPPLPQRSTDSPAGNKKNVFNPFKVTVVEAKASVGPVKQGANPFRIGVEPEKKVEKEATVLSNDARSVSRVSGTSSDRNRSSSPGKRQRREKSPLIERHRESRAPEVKREDQLSKERHQREPPIRKKSRSPLRPQKERSSKRELRPRSRSKSLRRTSKRCSGRSSASTESRKRQGSKGCIEAKKQEPSRTPPQECVRKLSKSRSSSDLSYSPARRNPERYRDILEKTMEIKSEKSPCKEPRHARIGRSIGKGDDAAQRTNSQKSGGSDAKNTKPVPVVRLQSQSDTESDAEKIAPLDEFQESERDRAQKELEMLEQLKTGIAAKAKQKIRTIEQMAAASSGLPGANSEPLVAALADSALVDTIVSKVSTATVAAAESAARRSRSRSRHSRKRSHSRSRRTESGRRTKSRSRSSRRYSSSSSRSHSERSSRSRSLSHSSHSSGSSKSSFRSSSGSSSSSSGGSSRTRSRSPSIPRRRGSPSFLDRRRITSARKRPIPYHRKTPSDASSICSSCCSHGSFPRTPSHSPDRGSQSPPLC